MNEKSNFCLEDKKNSYIKWYHSILSISLHKTNTHATNSQDVASEHVLHKIYIESIAKNDFCTILH